jgi:hypothetical protein
MVKKNSNTSKKNKKRDNFSDSTKKIIFENSGYCCAYPSCYEYVLLHNNKNKPTKSGWGQGAHIYDASKTTTIRPRPENIDDAFIKSEKNGMLLCGNHHKIIDSKENKVTYTAEILFSYKTIIEKYVKSFLISKKNKSYNELTNNEKEDLCKYLKNMSYKDPSDINTMDDKELLLFHSFQSLHGLETKFNKTDVCDFYKLKKINLDINNTSFSNNKEAMNTLSKYFTITEFKIQPFRLIDITILSKKYSNISRKIKNVEIKHHYDNKYIMVLDYFSDNIVFNNFVKFSLVADDVDRSLEVKINLNIEYLKNTNIEITDIKDISIFYELIESLHQEEYEFIIYKDDGSFSNLGIPKTNNTSNLQKIRKISHTLELVRQLSLRDSIKISTNELFSNMNSCLLTNSLSILKWLSNDITDTVIMPSINHKKSIKNIEIFEFKEVSYYYEITFINFNTKKNENDEQKINLIKTDTSEIIFNLFTS